MGGCVATNGVEPTEDWVALAEAYISDDAVAREALEASIIDPENGYSTLRLDRYRPDAWGALDTWNPRVKPVTVADLGGGTPPAPAEDDPQWQRLNLDGALESDGALTQLGAQAFEYYPLQLAASMRQAMVSREVAEDVGLWINDAGEVTGLVWVDAPGGVYPAMTCAVCHSERGVEGAPVHGAPNHRFDYGRVLDMARGGATEYGAWGPARVDVTNDDMFNPTTITDLRPIRFQETLHRAATLWNSPQALMVRVETLIITSMGQGLRPPKVISAALTRYLWSLGDALPEPAEGRGREVFDLNCAHCHSGPEMGGAAIPLDAVGTPDEVALSTARGTGTWRVPSLRGVGQRRPLFASGEVPDLPTLLDLDRAMRGHPFGLDLPEADREALLAFLQAL